MRDCFGFRASDLTAAFGRFWEIAVLIRLFVATLLIPFCLPASVWACYAVIVGRVASADGSVLVGHNEQNGGRRILNFRRIPRRRFDADAVVQLRRGGRLEQVPETWSFLWSENPGLEFSDAYVNEWGVAVASDSCPTREDDYEALVARGEIRDGGIGYMLRRVVVERAKSAREGVFVAGALVERFGYVHSGRTYVIADAREAWLLAVTRGRRWVARRVPDDRVVILPNVHIIGEVDLSDTANFMAAPHLINYAVKRGWFDPAAGQSFNFRKVYGVRPIDQPDPRRLRGRQLVMGQDSPESSNHSLSFGVEPARKMTVAAVLEILRDTKGSVPLCTPGTQEGTVFQLRVDMPAAIGCVYWRTTAAPYTSLLTPWYLGITSAPANYSRPATVEQAVSLDHHFEPPVGTFDTDLTQAWWKFKRLQDLACEDFGNRIADIRSAQAAFEGSLIERQPAIERKARDLWRTDRDAARKYLTEYCADTAARACQEAERMTAKFTWGR